jgi:hypothetical protein
MSSSSFWHHPKSRRVGKKITSRKDGCLSLDKSSLMFGNDTVDVREKQREYDEAAKVARASAVAKRDKEDARHHQDCRSTKKDDWG